MHRGAVLLRLRAGPVPMRSGAGGVGSDLVVSGSSAVLPQATCASGERLLAARFEMRLRPLWGLRWYRADLLVGGVDAAARHLRRGIARHRIRVTSVAAKAATASRPPARRFGRSAGRPASRSPSRGAWFLSESTR